MNNIKFKYNGKTWNPKNPEKKLKQLGITWDDVEIIEESKAKEVIEYVNPELYEFKNHNTGKTILSIHSSIDYLKSHVKDINDYEFIGMKKYE